MKSSILRPALCTAFVMSGLCVRGWAEENSLPPVATPGDGPLLLSELIYPENDTPTPQCHASTIVETSDGLVAAWFGGTHEKNPDVCIWVSRRDSRGWSRPVKVADGVQSETLRHPCWNPVLFQLPGEPLSLFYKVGPSPREWWGMVKTSRDHGQTWSDARKLGEDPALGEKNENLIGPVKNKPIRRKDGVLMCASSTEHDRWRVHFELSKDGGRTWQVIGPINDGRKFGAIQPSVLTYADGRMQILCRTQQGVVGQSWSKDGGRTWSDITATPLPNPNAGTDAATLADGRQLVVYNHTVRGGKFPSSRNMLNVALSQDGTAWETVLTLERDRGEYSYPAVIQTTDGKVHITYTWKRRSVKHAIIDPAKL